MKIVFASYQCPRRNKLKYRNSKFISLVSIKDNCFQTSHFVEICFSALIKFL